MDLDTVSSAFTFYVDTIKSYYDSAHEVADIILWTLLLFEIIVIGIQMALGKYNNLGELLKKVLFIGVWIYVAQNIDTLMLAFSETLQKMGTSLQGSNFDYLSNPISLFEYASKEIFFYIIDKIEEMLDISFWNILKVIPALVLLLVVFLCLVVCIAVIVLLLCLVQIEFYFILLMGILLIPFHINEHTKFIGSKVVAVTAFQGIRLLSISLVAGLVIESFKTVIDNALDVSEMSALFVIYLVIHIALGLYLILQAGSIIQAFMPGASAGNSPLQQMMAIAGSALAASSMVKHSKALVDKASSKVSGSVDAYKSSHGRGSEQTASAKNNIPTLQERGGNIKDKVMDSL